MSESEAYQAQLDAAGARLVAGVDWAKVSDDLARRLRAPKLLKEAIETPVRERTAHQAALIALARCRETQGWK